jgi:undecaprenyl phosphate N,N'-diacetylbacillosamine 1-phosphate transferase
MYRRGPKRIMDLCIAIPALLLTFPVIFLTGLFIFLQDGQIPFFTQLRPGKDARIFRLIKLRTMNNSRDAYGNLLPDDIRLTYIGRVIRKTSFDELPQLINVILGHMSLIGPRPLLPEYLNRYRAEDGRRHNVRPGITGLAQVLGRNKMKFSDRFKLDVYYVDNISLSLDIKIIFLTFKAIFFDTASVVNGQLVEEVDDLELSRDLRMNNKTVRHDN